MRTRAAWVGSHPVWLIKNIHVDGVQQVELISPTTNQVADDGAISIGTVTITNMGYDR